MHTFLNITIDGVDYLAIPRENVEHLLEDEEAFDVACYDRIKAQLASGDEEFIPAEFADRILEGESPVRVWREFRNLTLQSLAEQVNMPTVYVISH